MAEYSLIAARQELRVPRVNSQLVAGEDGTLLCTANLIRYFFKVLRKAATFVLSIKVFLNRFLASKMA